MPASYDIIRIGSILHDISRYFNDLENLNIQDIQDLSDSRNFYAASMILFALLNRVFDLGSDHCTQQWDTHDLQGDIFTP